MGFDDFFLFSSFHFFAKLPQPEKYMLYLRTCVCARVEEKGPLFLNLYTGSGDERSFSPAARVILSKEREREGYVDEVTRRGKEGG